MAKLFLILVGGCCILLSGCSSTKKIFCAKRSMSAHKFIYIADGALTEKYFIVKDSLQLEFSGNNLYSESVIKWNTCYDYSLIVKRIYYKEEGLQPGDTLSIRVQSFKNDTLDCIASAYYHSFPIKLLKVKYSSNMPKLLILYGTSLFLSLAGILLIRNGMKKTDFKSTMRLIHYRPIRNYGTGFSIALGVLCLILGVILLTIKSK